MMMVVGNNIKLILENVPAQNATMGMSFIPTLGQYGVNLKNFCTTFNDVSKKFKPNFPLRIIFHYNKEKDAFNFEYMGPSLGLLLPSVIKNYSNSELTSKNKLEALFLLYKITVIHAAISSGNRDIRLDDPLFLLGVGRSILGSIKCNPDGRLLVGLYRVE